MRAEPGNDRWAFDEALNEARRALEAISIIQSALDEIGYKDFLLEAELAIEDAVGLINEHLETAWRSRTAQRQIREEL